MKDWKKAVLWVLVGFCLVSVIGSIFSLGAYLQTVSIGVDNLQNNDKTTSFFIDITTWTLVSTIICFALIVVATIYSAKSKKLKLLKLVLVALGITFVISIFFIVFSYCIPAYLKFYNRTFVAFCMNNNTVNYMYYSVFFHYQSYLSTAVSIFLPILIAGGLIFGYLLCKAKQLKQENISEQTTAEN